MDPRAISHIDHLSLVSFAWPRTPIPTSPVCRLKTVYLHRVCDSAQTVRWVEEPRNYIDNQTKQNVTYTSPRPERCRILAGSDDTHRPMDLRDLEVTGEVRGNPSVERSNKLTDSPDTIPPQSPQKTRAAEQEDSSVDVE